MRQVRLPVPTTLAAQVLQQEQPDGVVRYLRLAGARRPRRGSPDVVRSSERMRRHERERRSRPAQSGRGRCPPRPVRRRVRGGPARSASPPCRPSSGRPGSAPLPSPSAGRSPPRPHSAIARVAEGVRPARCWPWFGQVEQDGGVAGLSRAADAICVQLPATAEQPVQEREPGTSGADQLGVQVRPSVASLPAGGVPVPALLDSRRRADTRLAWPGDQVRGARSERAGHSRGTV